ncbi:hypothetical protein L486_03700 [Kwoniella mangroviensis CBS 10435]|uniref:Uncharacterized protein n=2 Tax=Kwoniella mangrovensis TaxID=463800 RepID=A0A1B9IUI0_9TREE|nr:hypothetical protein L486_03700 [Kwoniella mangroviensis CBS 10435]
MPPKATYKVIRETSKPSSTWYPNAERYSYEDVIGTYPTFKAAKSVAETNLSEEWEENVSFWVKSVEEKKDYYEMKATFQEGETMRVYTVKEQVEKEDPSGTKTAKATSSAKAKQTVMKP